MFQLSCVVRKSDHSFGSTDSGVRKVRQYNISQEVFCQFELMDNKPSLLEPTQQTKESKTEFFNLTRERNSKTRQVLGS